jgi:hypothetical protein
MQKQYEFKVGVVEVNGLKIGAIRTLQNGFHFIPWVSGHTSSRKIWATPADCVPAWAKRTIANILAKAN